MERKGLKLFDKLQNQYILLVYEAVNKINLLKRQINDVNMLTKTKNYLLDDIY